MQKSPLTERIQNLQNKDGSLPAHAPYPLIYLDTRNHVMCATCATKQITDYFNFWNGEPADNEMEPDVRDLPVTGENYFEGAPLECECCNEMIESAYGDPERNELLDKISDLTRYNNCIKGCPKFTALYLNPYDKNKTLVTGEGNELVLQWHEKTFEDFYSDTSKSADHISLGTVRQAILAIEKELPENPA